MATPSTADLSESFAHLTLDNTDRLSTTDEISIHSLPDLQAFLELARKHDLDCHRQGLQGQNEFDDGVISSHLTPILRNDNLNYRRNLLRGEFSQTPHTDNLSPDVDGAAALFRTLQPYIDQYMAKKSGASRSEAPLHAYHQSDRDLDQDLKLEDTFDKFRRGSTDAMRPGSSLTTPPLSSGSQFTDSRGTFVEEDFCKPISHINTGHTGTNAKHSNNKDQRDNVWDAQTRGHEHVALELDLEAPHVELPDLTSHEINLAQEETSADGQTIVQLLMELEKYKQDNAELVNELRFLREQLKGTKTSGNDNKSSLAPETNRPPTPQPDIDEKPSKGINRESKVSEAVDKLDSDLETKDTIDESTIPKEFRPYYERLQLAKVDGLTSSEKSNLIKSIMLSLLVSDFDHLSSSMPQVGSYLRITSRFLDGLHRKLYENNEVGPLRYLRDYDSHTDDGLQECLDGMFKLIG